MALRQIVRSIVGRAFGLDVTGNPLWNRKDGLQLGFDADPTTGVPTVWTRTQAGVEANTTIGASGGSSTYAGLTDAATVDLPATNAPLSSALALKAPIDSPALTGNPTAPTQAAGNNSTKLATTAYADAAATAVAPNAPLVVTAGFTFAKATHANRRIDYNSAAAANLTFDGTAAYTTDDGNRLMQCGAGALTLVASGVTFSNPNSLPLTTTGIGSYIDIEWDATIGKLVVTATGAGGGATLGANTFTGIQTLPAGTVLLPSFRMAGAADMGFYAISAYSWGMTVGGGLAHNWDSGGNYRVMSLGSGLAVAEGANAKQGVTGAMTAGTITVSNTKITANSRLLLTRQAGGTNPGAVYESARTAGTSFTVTSTNAADTGTVAYEIFEPA